MFADVDVDADGDAVVGEVARLGAAVVGEAIVEIGDAELGERS